MAGRPEHRHTAPELHPAALDRQMGLEIAAAFGRVAMSFPCAADRRQTPENLRTEKPAIALGPVGILAVARASLRFGADRKRVASGQSVSVRVELGGRRLLKTKQN